MSSSREQRIRERLTDRFSPSELFIKDQSHLHAGHAGAADGRGHFDVRIVSDVFDGMNRIDRHRSIYQALDDLLESDIHALRINALTSADVEKSRGKN